MTTSRGLELEAVGQLPAAHLLKLCAFIQKSSHVLHITVSSQILSVTFLL